MFFSNNLLFLVSLAFASWLILCYLNRMDDAQDLPIRLDYSRDLNISEKDIERVVSSKKGSSYQRHYAAYINFFWLFSCIYVLAKIISLSENSVNGSGGRFDVNCTAGGDGEYKAFFKMRDNMSKQRKRNVFWEARMRDLKQSNLELMGKHLPFPDEVKLRLDGYGGYNPITPKDQDLHAKTSASDNTGVISESTDEGIDDENTVCPNLTDDQIMRLIATCNLPYSRQRNVFIANRFVHLNGQVYINEGNVKLTIQNGDCSDFVQIWEKYLGIRHFPRFSTPASAPEPTTLPPSTKSQVYLDYNKTLESKTSIKTKIAPKVTTLKAKSKTATSTIKAHLSDTCTPSSAFRAVQADSSKGNAKQRKKHPNIVFVTTEELESMKGKYI